MTAEQALSVDTTQATRDPALTDAADINLYDDPRNMLEEIGGRPALVIALDLFEQSIRDYNRAAYLWESYFRFVPDWDRLKGSLVDIVEWLLDNPTEPVPEDVAVMIQAPHDSLDITTADYWLTIGGHLLPILVELGVPRHVTLYLVDRLYDVQTLVVTEAAEPAHI